MGRQFVLIAVLFGATGCGDGGIWSNAPNPDVENTESDTQIANVDVGMLKSIMDVKEVVLIDVRTEIEFQGGHVPGARHIPLGQLGSQLRLIKKYRDLDVYLICATGARSLRAAQLLAESGFTNPINVAGGTNGWRNAGYPMD